MIHIQMYMFGVVIEFSKTNGSTWKTYEARMHSVPTRELDFYTNGAQCPVQKLNALPLLIPKFISDFFHKLSNR